MERMVRALRIVLESPRWMFESDGRSADAGTSIVDEGRPDVERESFHCLSLETDQAERA